MKTNTNNTKVWIITSLLGLCMVGFSCQTQPGQTPAPLPVNFELAGQYSITAIQIDPPLRQGQDLMAIYADSSGQSPCLSGATIRFDPTGWVSFTKPAGCEQNDDLTKITGLQNGEMWSIQDNKLLLDNLGQITQYELTMDGGQVSLSLDIDKGYASSLDDNPPGFTLTIGLKRLQ